MNDQNQQIIVEHIVNIDTTAQTIDSINAVALVASQVAAIAGMLPDVAATAQMRSTLTAVAKKLTEIKAVSDALPLMAALEPLVPQVSAIIGMRPELAAVTAQMDAIRRLSAALDTLLLAPEYAAQAEAAAEKALTASSVAEDGASAAEKSRLGAEFAEDEAKSAATLAGNSRDKAAVSAGEARQAADAAAAVSGLPDASAAAPGDPLIWNGSKFAVGTLDETLQSVNGALGLAAPVQESISTASANAAQASADAAIARTTAEGVDAKATQAATDATEAKDKAEAADVLAGSFGTRLTAAENETLNVGAALSAHAGTSDIHTPKADIEALAEVAVNRLKDGGDGSTLPADRATLLALSGIIDEVGGALDDFLNGAEPGKRAAILDELDRLAAELSGLGTGGLTRADVVNALDSDAQDAPLAAAQGPVLTRMIGGVRELAQSAARPWVAAVRTVPETWPENLHPDGLLLRYAVENDAIVNPEWYVFSAGKIVPLTVDASGIRLADGTTVQAGVASTLVAAQAAQNAATAAQTAAAQASTDAASAKGTAEGIDAKATQAAADATVAKTTAEGVDAKATQAQADAAEAVAKAAEALARSPDLATQTTPGIVKGSDTVTVDAEGALHAASGVTVISPPTVTIPAQVAVGYPFNIALAAGPVLLAGARVTGFEVSVNGGAPVTVPAVNGAATYSFTPEGEPDTLLSVSAVAVDSLGNMSKVTVAQAPLKVAFVTAPDLSAPADGGIFAIGGTLRFASSPFAFWGPSKDTHTASQYRAMLDDGTLLLDSGEVTSSLRTFSGKLTGDTVGDVVRCSARHKGQTLGWSDWGNANSTTVVEKKIVVACGTGGCITRSLDNGLTWEPVRRVPGMTNSWRSILSVYGVLIVCGEEGKVSRSIDGGETWSTATPVAGHTTRWENMCSIGSVVFICGYSGRITQSTDYGLTWTPFTVVNGFTDNWSDIINVDGVLVLGGKNTMTYARSTDSGATWSALRTAGSSIQYSFRTLCAIDDTIIGSGDYGSLNISPNKGVTWGTMRWVGSSILGHSAVVDGTVYLSSNEYAYLWKSIDKGANWANTATIPGFAAPGGMLGVENKVIVVGGGGKIVTTDDGGQTWNAPVQVSGMTGNWNALTTL